MFTFQSSKKTKEESMIVFLKHTYIWIWMFSVSTVCGSGSRLSRQNKNKTSRLSQILRRNLCWRHQVRHWLRGTGWNQTNGEEIRNLQTHEWVLCQVSKRIKGLVSTDLPCHWSTSTGYFRVWLQDETAVCQDLLRHSHIWPDHQGQKSQVWRHHVRSGWVENWRLIWQILPFFLSVAPWVSWLDFPSSVRWRLYSTWSELLEIFSTEKQFKKNLLNCCINKCSTEREDFSS